VAAGGVFIDTADSDYRHNNSKLILYLVRSS